jgi:hypothetical protein
MAYKSEPSCIGSLCSEPPITYPAYCTCDQCPAYRAKHAVECAARVPPRSSSHHAGPCSVAGRQPICATWSTLFSVEHSFGFVKHRALSRRFRAGFRVRESRPCESACELQLSKQLSENTKRREVAAHECFRLAGSTGLEPATSGVTGRRANVL